MQRVDDSQAHHPVDRRMMHLEAHGEGAFGHSPDPAEPVDEVALPGRPTQIHPLLMQPRHLLAQLPPATGARQRQVVQMPAQLKVLVAHPVRVIQIERDTREHRAKNTVRAESRADMGGDIAEGDSAARRRRRIVDREEGHMRRARGLGVHECGIQAAQLLHPASGDLSSPAKIDPPGFPGADSLTRLGSVVHAGGSRGCDIARLLGRHRHRRERTVDGDQRDRLVRPGAGMAPVHGSFGLTARSRRCRRSVRSACHILRSTCTAGATATAPGGPLSR